MDDILTLETAFNHGAGNIAVVVGALFAILFMRVFSRPFHGAMSGL